MIKKPLLITGILLSTSLWADMDYTCDTFVYDSITVKQADLLGSLCERNNIFRAYGFDEEGLHAAIAQWCRFDRQIEFYRSEKEGMRDEFYDTLPNYENGTNLYDYPEYLGKLKFGCMTIFDHQCLHRTLKEDGGLRVSIDFSIKLACTELLDKNTGGRNVKHRPKEEVLKIGDETSVEASETLQECYERFKNDKYDGVATSHINDIVS